MKSHIFIIATSIVCLTFFQTTILAQSPSEVSLVVFGEGQTKQEAIDNALRSAIEQTYGTFVSANTNILNDDIVKDEIVTVSSGNIKSYKELTPTERVNEIYSANIQAVVSVGKLVTFARNKGSECEFAGATFGANLKLFNLYRKNAEIALSHLYEEMKQIASVGLFDWEVTVTDPKSDGSFNLTVTAKATSNLKIYGELISNTLKAISVSEEQNKAYLDMGEKLLSAHIVLTKPTYRNPDEKFIVKLWDVPYEYGRPGYKQCPYPVSWLLSEPDWGKFDELFCRSLNNFKITDNLGNTYDIPYQMPKSKPSYIYDRDIKEVYIRQGTNDDYGFENLYCFGIAPGIYNLSENGNGCNAGARVTFVLPFDVPTGQSMYMIKYSFKVPIETLTQISSFKVSPIK